MARHSLRIILPQNGKIPTILLPAEWDNLLDTLPARSVYLVDSSAFCSTGTINHKRECMRAVVQRVEQASVTVDSRCTGSISRGLLVLLGVGQHDTEKDVAWMCEKIIHLRIFNDEHNKMNLSLADIKGELLIVSQFTLYGDCRKGRRPGFSEAAPPRVAEDLYQLCIARIQAAGYRVVTGTFQAHMDVQLTNSGPVTMLLDSSKLF